MVPSLALIGLELNSFTREYEDQVPTTVVITITKDLSSNPTYINFYVSLSRVRPTKKNTPKKKEDCNSGAFFHQEVKYMPF